MSSLYVVPDLPDDDYPPDSWQDYAACRGMDPALFFPERGEDTSRAKEVCFSCPVMDYCRNWAVTTFEKHGIWGGTSERERRRIRIANNITWLGTGTIQREHGTLAGYQQHRRSQTRPCDACLAAKARYERRLNGSRR